ncbi:hypothetical protein JCM8547_006078 [Rhodosporidiobolus lusitaniae]
MQADDSQGAEEHSTLKKPRAPPAPPKTKGRNNQGGKGGGGGKSKKAKTSNETDEGGVDCFSSLPLDVLFLICSELHPLDVLAISHTSKEIRRTLLAKSSAPVWSAARRTVAMPDIEADDISEARYVFLVEGNTCQVCGTTKKGTQFEHHVRVRCCSKCLRDNLRTQAWTLKNHDEDLHGLTFDCALSTPYSAAGEHRVDKKHYFFLPEVLHISSHLTSLASADPVQLVDGDGVPTKTVSAVEAFVARRAEIKKAVLKDVNEIYTYQVKSLDANLAREDEKRAERKKAIHAKLAGLGFEEADYKNEWRLQSFYSSTKPLTPAAWGVIKKAVLVHVTQNKQARLARERIDRQRARQDQLKPLREQLVLALAGDDKLRATFPAHQTFLSLDSVKPLWEGDEVVVDPAGWGKVKPKIMKDVEKSVERTKRRLFEKLAKALLAEGAKLPAGVKEVLEEAEPSNEAYGKDKLDRFSDADIDEVLARPSSLFTCPCDARRPYPDVVSHVTSEHATQLNFGYAYDLPPASFRKAVRSMLEEKGMKEEETTHGDLEGMGAVFAVVHKKQSYGWYGTWTEQTETGQTWQDVLTARQHSMYAFSAIHFCVANIVSIRIISASTTAA